MRAVFLTVALLAASCIAKESIEITAERFEAVESERMTEFSGDVKVQKGEDRIEADSLRLILGENKKPKRYELKGDVSFRISLDGKQYEGSAKEALYLEEQGLYRLSGKVSVIELGSGNRMSGEEVVLDQKKGRAMIEGGKEPVRFIYEIEE